MKTTTVHAVFNGQNGSCGFTNGIEYPLLIKTKLLRRIRVVSLNSGLAVEYDNIHTFLSNWTNIKFIKTEKI